MTAFATSVLVLTLGKVICGIGMAAARFRPSFGAISRQTPPEKRCRRRDRRWLDRAVRDRAFASLLQHRLDNWHIKMSILGVVSTAMAPLAPGLREPRAAASRGIIMPLGSRAGLQEAFATLAFWLLTAGLFVCTFHVTFIGLHLPAHIPDKAVGVSVFGRPASALELGGWAIWLAGVFNLAGSLIWGWLGSRYPKKDRRRPWPSRSKSMG